MRPAPVAVDIDRDKPAIEPGHPQRAQERVGQLLALEAGIIARSVAGLMDFVEIRRAQKLVVIRKNPFVSGTTMPTGVSKS